MRMGRTTDGGDWPSYRDDQEEGHQTKFYFLRSLSDAASTEAHMVLSGHQSLKIRALVSSHMQSPALLCQCEWFV